MFIGHLPGAYVALRVAAPRMDPAPFAAAMIGSVAPDIDMLWFHFVDHGSRHHHDYITHRPILWISILLLGLLLRFRSAGAGALLAGFGLGGTIHMALDSIVGKISWVWPISDYAQPLVVVPATRSHWILSFLSHWTFAVEIGLTALAVVLVWRFPRHSTSPH